MSRETPRSTSATPIPRQPGLPVVEGGPWYTEDDLIAAYVRGIDVGQKLRDFDIKHGDLSSP